MDKNTAFLDGWLAHKNGVEVEDNPFDERRQARSRSQWTSGWCARFGAVKHGEDLPYDDLDYLD